MENQFNTSLWGDEAFSAILSMKSIPNIIRIIINDTSPPLYNITEHIAFKIFGSSEIVIRGLSFFYYSLAIFFVFLIAKHLWNKRIALLAATLTFLNPFFFIYAFEGRMYSILAAGVAASMYFFLCIRDAKKPSNNLLIGYTLSTAWALYSHHFAIFIVFTQILWFLWEFFFGKRSVAIEMLKGFAATAIVYSPWILPLYHQTKMVGGGFWLGKPTVKDLLGLIVEYLGAGIKSKLMGLSFLFIVLLIGLRKWEKDIKDTLFLSSWFLIPILATWLVSQIFQSIFFNRYLLYTIPGAMLLAVSNGRKILSTVVFCIAILILIAIDYHYFTHPGKRPFAQMAQYVKTQLAAGDFLINWNASSHHLWETKYYAIPAPIYVGEKAGELPFFVGTALMDETDVIRQLPENIQIKRVGVITSGSIDEVTLPGYTKISTHIFGDLKFIWLKPT